MYLAVPRLQLTFSYFHIKYFYIPACIKQNDDFIIFQNIACYLFEFEIFGSQQNNFLRNIAPFYRC